MKILDDLLNQTSLIESKLGYTFQNKLLIPIAFTHRSFVNENKSDVQEHNERMEFLGDAVLNIVVSEYLYKYLPSTPEGELSYLRSRLVESASCVAYINKLDVSSFLLLGRGEQRNDGRGRETILANLFEAVIGAIFLDGGIQAVKGFFFKNFTPEISETIKAPVQNWKADLQDFSQKRYQVTPFYKVVKESGPDHSKVFEVVVEIQARLAGSGQGSSKKEAQQAAACDALNRLKEERL